MLLQPHSDPRLWDGPASREAQPVWLKNIQAERETVLRKINYTGGVFDVIPWTQTSWMQPQMHPYDRSFYDPASGEYTVGRYLADLRARYGGIDSLLLWPTYTNIGIDDRNQFDYFRTMPGGLEGVRRVTAELHAEGVKVMWPYNPWDTGTRREGSSDQVALAALLKQTGGDGFNGDTMGSVGLAFWNASLAVHHPLGLEPEGGGTDEALNWATMGWGYWRYPAVPAVNRFKFLTRGRFMAHVCDRWAKDRTDNLQAAWFNGAGYETWENVWGTWNGITPRDAEAIRRVGHMQRFFGAEAGGGLLLSAGWEPHTPEAVQPTVFASRWPDARGRRVLWTLVNRGDALANGTQLVVAAPSGGARWFDCYRGTELTARVALGTDGAANTASLSFPLGGGGYGCALQTGGEGPDGALSAFLAEMAAMTKAPLASYSAQWRVMQQRLRPVPPSPPAVSPPPGAVALPAAHSFLFSTRGLEIEGDDAHGVDAQFPWEEAPRREHSHTLAVPPLFIDRHPVTTANYSAYRRAAGYAPKDPLNWLSNWRPGWPFTTPPEPGPLPPKSPPPRMADWPVTYVSLDEARDYCAWAGGRLPRAWEWQYAGQGTDGRLYPWGNHTCDSCWPAFATGSTFLGPEPVTAHSPAGDSPFGVSDLAGNVWQYTDEIADEHTRAVLLRGGSNYRPDGSHWYFPNRGGPGSGPPCTTHNKYFLFGESYERAGTVGFRCVYDRPAPATPPLGPDRAAGIGVY